MIAQYKNIRPGDVVMYADLDYNALLLLTHLNNKTGLILPVKEIVAMARAKGADVIVVGAAHKAARIRYLRDRWVSAARTTPGIDVLTPDDRDMVAGITSFRLHLRTGRAQNQAARG